MKSGLVFTITELMLAEVKASPAYQNPKKNVDEVIPKSAILNTVLLSLSSEVAGISFA
jgi:hypothetical protein